MDWKLIVASVAFICLYGGGVSRAEDGLTLPELCPCLPANLCPRIYGASVDDRKYLGEFMKCSKDSEVRCCGASTSMDVNVAEEEIPNFLSDNLIEDVRIEHLTIPPPVTTTTTEQVTTTEFMDTTTVTEEPQETTTTEIGEEETTTTEPSPPEAVTLPRFGKGVQFIYAVRAEDFEQESKRKGKNLVFDSEEQTDPKDVFVIMPQQFLQDENSAAFNEIEETVPATTTEAPPPTLLMDDSEIVTTTTIQSLIEDGLGSDEAATFTTEIPEITTTTTTTTESTTTTHRPRIRKKIRVKVRKGFFLQQHGNELAPEPASTTDDQPENTRKNRDLDEPKRKINHSLYARRKHLLEMRNNILTTTTTSSPATETTAVSVETSTTSTTTETTSSSAHQNPALLSVLASNAAKRRSFLRNRVMKAMDDHKVPEKAAAVSDRFLRRSEKIPTQTMEKKHQQMIEQVLRAVKQESMMSTFDVADELMDPQMAVKIAEIQRMIAEEIMERVLARIEGKSLNSSSSSTTTESPTPPATTSPSSTTVVTENPIDAPESKEPLPHPYRGSKRYIDTNFLNAYENVIHKVEEKIKTHKTRVRVSTTTQRPEATTGNVQVLLTANPRRRTLQRSSTTTTAAPVTEQSPVLETITELIEELEKIQEEVEKTAKFEAFPLHEGAEDSADRAEELSAPIDLLGRNARGLEGFLPIPSVQQAPLELPAPSQRRRFRFL